MPSMVAPVNKYRGGGGGIGGIIGGIVGAAAGIILAPVTAGASIPAGIAAGTAAGSALGGAAGNLISPKKETTSPTVGAQAQPGDKKMLGGSPTENVATGMQAGASLFGMGMGGASGGAMQRRFDSSPLSQSNDPRLGQMKWDPNSLSADPYRRRFATRGAY